ncbi:MAG: hypothetical protein Q9184_000003 [Pyrenodesmia sp. 2 TL-2023]
MAVMHYHLPSQGSSGSASYTYLTPSETLPTASGIMLDASQTGFDTDTRASDVSLPGLTGADEAWLMNIDPVWRDLWLPAEQSSAGDTSPGLITETQYNWVAANSNQANSPQRHPHYIHDDRGSAVQVHPHLVPEDGETGCNQDYYVEKSQRMRKHIVAFNDAYQHAPVSEPGLPTNPLVSDRPRHIPDIDDGVAVPWSTWIASQQIHREQLVAELLYEPAAEFAAASEPLLPSLARGANPADALDSDVPVETDTSSDGAMPDDNIDPPPRPDPVGPPSELCKFEHDDDEICIGCKKKVKKSLLRDCIRIRLPDLTTIFIPGLAEQDDAEKLCAFARKRVRRYLDNHMVVYLTWGYDRPIKCDATEIEPVGSNLLQQNQFRLNLATNRYDVVTVPSPPLGMILMAVAEWRRKFNIYLEELLETNFRQFPDVCFRGNDCRVAKDFLIPIFEYHEAATERAQKLVHQCLKLVILTHIMTHQLTLLENTKDSVYEQLNNPPPEKYSNHTSPRWLSRQIKFLLATLHRDVMKSVLGLVQDTLRRADRKPLWAALFASMLVVAMMTETQQQTLRCKEKTDKQEGTIRPGDETADEAIGLMDERFELLKNLFHQGYRTLSPKGFNPLQSSANRDSLDQASQLFAAKASAIVEQHCGTHFKVSAVL